MHNEYFDYYSTQCINNFVANCSIIGRYWLDNIVCL